MRCLHTNAHKYTVCNAATASQVSSVNVYVFYRLQTAERSVEKLRVCVWMEYAESDGDAGRSTGSVGQTFTLRWERNADGRRTRNHACVCANAMSHTVTHIHGRRAGEAREQAAEKVRQWCDFQLLNMLRASTLVV